MELFAAKDFGASGRTAFLNPALLPLLSPQFSSHPVSCEKWKNAWLSN